jgi:hypothetical protein
LARPDGRITERSLFYFLYFVETDDELDLLLKALNKFQAQEGSFNFKLSMPIMQLLYLLNKTDKALELFMCEV